MEAFEEDGLFIFNLYIYIYIYIYEFDNKTSGLECGHSF